MNTQALDEFIREHGLCNRNSVMRGFFDVLTVMQPYASLLVSGLKAYEFRSYRLPEHLIGKPVLIHAGAKPMNAIVKVSKQIYDCFLFEARMDDLFKCIVGVVVFGEPEISDTPIFTGYRWPVKDCFKFKEPIRNIRGQQKIWKLGISSPIKTEKLWNN